MVQRGLSQPHAGLEGSLVLRDAPLLEELPALRAPLPFADHLLRRYLGAFSAGFLRQVVVPLQFLLLPVAPRALG